MDFSKTLWNVSYTQDAVEKGTGHIFEDSQASDETNERVIKSNVGPGWSSVWGKLRADTHPSRGGNSQRAWRIGSGKGEHP